MSKTRSTPAAEVDAMSLITLVAQDKWQEFDDAWTELIVGRGPIDELLGAVRIAGEKKRLPRCLPLLREHAEALAADDRAADAARLIGQAIVAGASPGELVELLISNVQKAWGSEPWFETYATISGLKPGAPDPRRAWIAFERLMGFEAGKLVFHPGGWGAGEIVEFDRGRGEMLVRFGNGRRDTFPLSAATDIFEPLPESDLRAQFFRDPEALRRKLKEEPLEILRAVVTRYNGRVSTVALKNALLQVGVEGSSWSGWWRRARKLAESSEWFKVTGTASKGEIQLLHSATDPVEDLRRQLAHAPSLSELLARIRDQLAGNRSDERMKTMLLDVLEEKAAKTGEDAPGPIRLAAWMLLREERATPQLQLSEHLRRVADEPAPDDPTKPPALWALFHTVQGLREQERCVASLEDLFGERWLDEASANLQHAPVGMVRPLVDALFAAGRREDLARHYLELLGRPLRAPDLLIALARLAETGKLPGNYPPPVQRAQALLSLATTLFTARRDERTLRTQVRLVELLTKGKEPLLRKLLAGADYEALLGLQRMLQRGVDEAIDYVFTDVTMRAQPASSRGQQPGFWEGDHIWTTKRGLEKRRAELRVLMEVKIPENQDAIGRAAAMGDLSENSEWEMAIQEQRNLTQRASQIEAELRHVELIDDALLSEDTVSPGTTVRYRELPSGGAQEITILGPWDTDQGDQVVSYRAPLAAGLLGRRPGDKVRVTLPSGPIELEVLEARPVHFD
jgi:transcription elongation factor GreA